MRKSSATQFYTEAIRVKINEFLLKEKKFPFIKRQGTKLKEQKSEEKYLNAVPKY